MANFVELDKNNEVLRVVVVNDDYLKDENGNEVEQLGINHMESVYGTDTKWIQTSYNDNMRVRFGRVGYTYNETLDAFIPPKPYDSWVLNETTADWEPPIPKPEDDQIYNWNEETQSWDLVVPEPESETEPQ